MLDRELCKLGVLPDPRELRLVVPQEVTREAAVLAGLKTDKEVERSRSRINRLLKLLPTYRFDESTIPIAEFPDPPVESPAERAAYVTSKLDRLVPYEST